MPQKDVFLTRVQAQLLATLERARQLEADGHTAEALTTLHEAQRSLVGLDSDLLTGWVVPTCFCCWGRRACRM